jgi:hypothetical protein
MKLLFASLSLLFAVSLSAVPTGTPAPADAAQALAVDDAVSRAAATAPDDGDLNTCPLIWTCEPTGAVYSTRASCRAECPAGGCVGEIICDGFCVCP